jgi:aryl-alcohol dehydrogenase-like predicted oxidoreductase
LARQSGLAIVSSDRSVSRRIGITQTAQSAVDVRNNAPRFSPEARQANMVLVAVIRGTARRKAGTEAQVALAWLLARGNGINSK